MSGALDGIRVLDLSRVLAGPWSTQVLGDLGAEVIKVEQPGAGDDTRAWGPPFLPDSQDSAYFSCANRNKRSIAIDIASQEGADLIRRLAAVSDVLVENFRVGGLAKYGLDYDDLRAIKPDLVWCSITGFGQTGPEKDRGGYDFLIQGMSGLMSVTGAADGPPTKVGVPISDLTTGLYAAISILAALRHRDRTGEGQRIDLALLDAQVALMSNQAANWLNGGSEPRRLGNQHPNIVPYQVFACADGDILIATANDRQFGKLCRVLGLDALAGDERFAAMKDRGANRDALLAELEPVIGGWQSEALVTALNDAGVPSGRVNTVPEALAHPQVAARGLVGSLERADGSEVGFVGFPALLSRTPATYRAAPPRAGENGDDVLHDVLGITESEVASLREAGVVA
ncbi:Succinyl-CoA:(R)-benzylsuccinate CoA-transferase subunit BbsF [Tsuneonella dongtanensis]|uniref:Succinyl-CoA:(R)-benzylsuccinate CoA-transferase subunit BbsF n=1 Tax=Tsuneonella dongtanensis TaxID=692370 RepID=A0A1B2AFA0_9SPHN|nr:CoA transferase [Tsuneonella dongtanensis]ANY20837.1 Succinyl-CoA:(R)-benzylsuccinate CoA-transferase subunit BbsF [Tsuneonella dongtanensis]